MPETRPSEPLRCENDDLHFAYEVIFDGLRLCGCGNPEDVVDLALEMLRACPWYEGAWEVFSERLTSVGFEFIAHQLSAADLVEHGSSVGGSWITDKGRRFLAVAEGREYDDLTEVGYRGGSCCPGTTDSGPSVTQSGVASAADQGDKDA